MAWIEPGLIPSDFEQLKNLKTLYLDSCVGGPIPAFLGKLQNLTKLDLVGNNFWGPLPTELFQLVNLEELVLTASCQFRPAFNDKINGTIPPEIGQLKNLKYLDITGHALSGKIPAEIAQLSNLVSLSALPDMFATMTSLGTFSASKALLKGQIPPSLSHVLQTNSCHVNLGTNLIRGNIPDSWTNITCANYGTLDVSGNLLSGRIPLNFLQTYNMAFYVQSNYISGPTQEEFDYKAHTQFYVDNNCFNDKNPDDCARFSASPTATSETASASTIITSTTTTTAAISQSTIPKKTTADVPKTSSTIHDTNNPIAFDSPTFTRLPSTTHGLHQSNTIAFRDQSTVTPSTSVSTESTETAPVSSADIDSSLGGFLRQQNVPVLTTIALGILAFFITAAFTTGIYIGRRQKDKDRSFYDSAENFPEPTEPQVEPPLAAFPQPQPSLNSTDEPSLRPRLRAPAESDEGEEGDGMGNFVFMTAIHPMPVLSRDAFEEPDVSDEKDGEESEWENNKMTK
ncbi:hypothetical protein HDU97_006656 [Phlyctochytrium planicorne]|nr:hypothetical protein HDU97_006656 [Phlyctochytrium planicorne]